MKIGLIGKKAGMTRIFQEDGSSVPVTVLEIEPNRITQIKSVENDGYVAVQVTAGSKKSSRVNKPEAGHFAKSGVMAGKYSKEFRTDAEVTEKYSAGDTIGLEILVECKFVDVSGVSIGKGFAGPIKKYHFRTQDATHGNSRAHRAPGSIGQRQTPGRVFKGKKMASHMGNISCTIQNLEVIKVDCERNLLLVKGAVPGSKESNVVVYPAIKKSGAK
jgi:large subunit ribosomal protein L3